MGSAVPVSAISSRAKNPQRDQTKGKVMETIKEGKTVFRRDIRPKATGSLHSCAESLPCIKLATLALNKAGVIDIHHHQD